MMGEYYVSTLGLQHSSVLQFENPKEFSADIFELYRVPYSGVTLLVFLCCQKQIQLHRRERQIVQCMGLQLLLEMEIILR